MHGIRSVLDMAKGALMAQQKAMTVTGHNIANVNTPGYSRQKVILEANTALFTSRIKIGMGAMVGSVVQYVDQFTNRLIFQKTSLQKEYESKTFILSHMEAIFNEANDHGLTAAMDEFWKAWQDLSNNPGGLPERTALLGKAEILSRQFNTMNSDLNQIRRSMNTNLGTSVTELNRLVKQIAELNEKIVLAEADDTTANDLRDSRTKAVEKLSELIGNVSLEDRNGALTVMTSDGILLVDGNQHWTLSQEVDGIYWNNTRADVSRRLVSGKIGAWLDIRDEIIPQYLANLNELAGTFIHQVNTLHLTGYSLSGETGKYFFENFRTPPDTPNENDFTGAASYIRLSSDVKGRPENISAGGISGDPGDNEKALQILSLQTDGTLQMRKWTVQNRGGDVSSSLQIESMDDYYRTLIGELGILSEELIQNQGFSQAMIDNLNELRDSVSGVNLDEEMTEMIKIQRAYEAIAKLVTIADEMLQAVLEMR